MSNLKTGHIIEAVLWLTGAAFLYAQSFAFEREIEIYKFGAVAWPRAILGLIAIAAIGQLVYHWQVPATDAPSGENAKSTPYPFKWYLSTFFLLALPVTYALLPEWIYAWSAPTETAANQPAFHAIKLVCAGGLIALYLAAARKNLVGAMLALPIFFGVLMSDMGFYALAPFFVVGVMYLMGERRPHWIAATTALIIGLVLMLFVSLLYVGLPTGNVSPFYEIGTGLVTLLQ